MILTVFKYLRHCRKKVYAHKFDSKILFKYISHFPELFILLNVENIANTILVALEVSISIFRKDHSVLKKKLWVI